MDAQLETRDAAEFPIEDTQIPTEGIDIQAESIDEFDVTGGFGTITEESIAAGDELEPQIGDDSQPKDDPRRHEFWQSKHDKLSNEKSDLQRQVSFYENTMAPLEHALQQNPDIMDMLEQRVTGQSQSFSNRQPQGNQQMNPEDLSKMPTQPTKPSSYNEVDAYSDPESESFKYNANMQGYLVDKIAALERADIQRENAYRMQAQQQRTDAIISNARTSAQSFGATQSEANEFVQWLSNPAEVTPENMYRVYKSLKGAPTQRKTEDRKRQMMDQQERLKAPTPAAVQTGRSPSPKSAEDLFNDGLLTYKR